MVTLRVSTPTASDILGQILTMQLLITRGRNVGPLAPYRGTFDFSRSDERWMK